MICVNADVQPSEFLQSEWKSKIINISILYNSTMEEADIVVNVSDQQDCKGDTHEDEDNVRNVLQFNELESDSRHSDDTEKDKDKLISRNRNERPICRKKRTPNNVDITRGPIPPELLKPCAYYRQKQKYFNEECPACWPSYSVLQRSAGQKVIDKISALNKIFEDEELKRKSKQMLLIKNSNAVEGNVFPTLPTRRRRQIQMTPQRKPIKLQPIQTELH